MKRFVLSGLFCALLLRLPASLWAQTAAGDPVHLGIEAYKQADFLTALNSFRAVVRNPGMEARHGDARFWLAKTALALGRYEEAEQNLEHFLSNYPNNPFIPEAYYERGRLLYLRGEFQASLQALQSFIERFPDSAFRANAYYWSGECLYELGDLENAQRLFNLVISDYPTSFRVEAARYKSSLIDLKYREAELLKLLRWSHEEYLNVVEEFRRRDKEYADAIASYQARIRQLSGGDVQGELTRLNERVRVLEAELETIRGARAEQSSRFGQPSPLPNPADQAWRLELSALKEASLRSKEGYLQILAREREGE